MKYDLLIVDSREKGNKKILEYFDDIKQDYIISKLDVGDYMLYKCYDVIIDKKDGLLELAHNLCNTKEHERIKNEILRSKQLGYKKFIFLVQDSSIKSEEDIKKWKSDKTKVTGETLLKIIKTMQKNYGVKFMFTSRKNIGKKIIELLGEKNENSKKDV